MEIGYRQKEKILKMLIRKFPHTKVEIFLDLSGKERVIAAYTGWQLSWLERLPEEQEVGSSILPQTTKKTSKKQKKSI